MAGPMILDPGTDDGSPTGRVFKQARPCSCLDEGFGGSNNNSNKKNLATSSERNVLHTYIIA